MSWCCGELFSMVVTVSIVKKARRHGTAVIKLPPTKRKKTRDVDEFHWEAGQITSEDMMTQNKEKGCYNASSDVKIRRDVLKSISVFDSWHHGS